MLLVVAAAVHTLILRECDRRAVSSQGRLNITVGVILLLFADGLLFAGYRLMQTLSRVDRINHPTGVVLPALGCLLTAFLLLLLLIGLMAGLS